MKDISTYLNEGFYKNVGTDPHIWSDYMYVDGFQFGWSARIKDQDWWPMFDMNYLRNYYQKYCDVSKVGKIAPDTYHPWGFFEKKYPKVGVKGEHWFDYNRQALVFAVLDTKYAGKWDDKEIKNQISKFLNKENGADKDTFIDIEDIETWGVHKSRKRITITNNRVAPISRELYMEFIIPNAEN